MDNEKKIDQDSVENLHIEHRHEAKDEYHKDTLSYQSKDEWIDMKEYLCGIQDNPSLHGDVQYVNLLQNPEGFTGF
jgi:hypothetical protein